MALCSPNQPEIRRFFFFFCFFASLAREGKKITPSSRERHKGITGTGHDLRLSPNKSQRLDGNENGA